MRKLKTAEMSFRRGATGYRMKNHKLNDEPGITYGNTTIKNYQNKSLKRLKECFICKAEVGKSCFISTVFDKLIENKVKYVNKTYTEGLVSPEHYNKIPFLVLLFLYSLVIKTARVTTTLLTRRLRWKSN
jgi:hypothetical protein